MSGQGEPGSYFRPALTSTLYRQDPDQQRLLGTPPTPSAFSSATLLGDSWASEPKSPGTPFPQTLSHTKARPYRRLEWYSIVSLFMFGIYSTILSGAWLALAIGKPRWDPVLNLNGSALTASTASTITTALAKTIELSFLTFYLAMLGQHLTRRASNHDAPGVSLADLQLKVLMALPGTLVTQWKSYGRILRTLLGIASLVACFSALLYSTASEALVSPKLVPTSDMKTLYGELKTTPANKDYIEKDCPATEADDKENCLTAANAGLGFTNFVQFLTDWQQLSDAAASVDGFERPQPVAVFKQNITVQGSWVDQSGVQAAERTPSRTIANVSMVMPHSGVVAAAALADNGLHSFVRAEVDTVGFLDDSSAASRMNANLDIDAQTVVPMINVLCAAASDQELIPLIYTDWPHADPTAAPTNMTIDAGWHNSTVFDPIFGFDTSLSPPVFYRYPGANNSELNGNPNADSSLYLLLASQSAQEEPVTYNLCALTMSLRGGCSTSLSTSSSSSLLKSNCDEHDTSFNQPLSLAQTSTPASWTVLARSWAEAVALNTAKTDTNAAAPRMLSELVLASQASDPKRPSVVEALAVLAGNTLLDSMVDAPFDGSWTYSTPTLEEPAKQSFRALVTMSVYRSGPAANAPWQYAFMAVLGSVFVLSLAFFLYLLYISLGCCCCCCCFGSRRKRHRDAPGGLRKDCTDLPELFEIALNSQRPGRGSPAGLAQQKGELRNARWHFRSGNEPSRSPDGLDVIYLTFDGTGAKEEAWTDGQSLEEFLMVASPASQLAKSPGGRSGSRSGEYELRKFTPLGLEERYVG